MVNALIHRDYFIIAPVRVLAFADRMEISNPGHLPNHLTVKQIRYGLSNMRNPLLASRTAHLLPYRGLGSGIPRALKAWPSIELVDDHAGTQLPPAKAGGLGFRLRYAQSAKGIASKASGLYHRPSALRAVKPPYGNQNSDEASRFSFRLVFSDYPDRNDEVNPIALVEEPCSKISVTSGPFCPKGANIPTFLS